MLQRWNRAPARRRGLTEALWIARRQRQELFTFPLPAQARDRVRRAVAALVRHRVQPTLHFSISQLRIHDQASPLHARSQWHVEAITQEVDEALDLAFSLSTVGLAHLGQEAVMAGKVQERRLEAMQSRTVSVARQDHRLHVVVQHPMRHALEPFERIDVTALERRERLVGDELDVAVARVPQRCDEGRQRILARAEVTPVHLQLIPGARLEAHHGIRRRLRLQPRHIRAQDRALAGVTALGDLASEHARWDPLRMRLPDPSPDVLPERFELGHSHRPLLGLRRTLGAQILANGVPRQPKLRTDRSDAQPLAPQYLDLHIPLQPQHARALHMVGPRVYTEGGSNLNRQPWVNLQSAPTTLLRSERQWVSRSGPAAAAPTRRAFDRLQRVPWLPWHTRRSPISSFDAAPPWSGTATQSFV